MSELIRVVDLYKSYYDGATELPVLKGVNLEVQKAEILAIVGPSGAGKSTLLHLIGALDRPTEGLLFSVDEALQRDLNGGNISAALAQAFKDAGYPLSQETEVLAGNRGRGWLIKDRERQQTYPIRKGKQGIHVHIRGKVIYEEQDIFELEDKALDQFRNQEIGFVFQFHHLLPEFTALENAAMGALVAGQKADAANERARELLDYVGLSKRLEHRPYELSGGERQRVAIARALINQPKVVLADEPTGNLDRKTSEAVHDLLWELNDRFGQTFIIVTHNQTLAQRADRLIHLVDGKVSDQVQASISETGIPQTQQ
jgi:lipoprotein-releasing system ATP-binding protein